jgi:hypothetical protein
VRLGYAAVGCFGLWATLSVAVGPDLPMMLFACLVVPLMAVVALVVGVRLIVGPRRRVRILPLALASASVATIIAAPEGAAVDLHLITRVYLAGGPGAINDWGQGLMSDQQGKIESRIVERDQLPAEVRDHLPGFVSVGGTIWSDLPRVRIELGGGFYHYGVVVYPTSSGPPVDWWQRVVGWPPEVVIYHEE